MSRGSKNKNQTCPARPRTLLLSALTAGVLAAGLSISGVRPASAAGYVYQQHTLNAGVLVNDVNAAGTGPASNPAPYLFYVLNNRPDVRPVALNLVNPLAPSTVTPAILNRWTSYTLGQAVTPNMAPYWEVSLNDTSDSQLAQYDILYLPAGVLAFGPNVNEKLRRFVDGGGQLIVEYGTALSPSVAGLFTGTGPGQISSTSVTPPASGTAFLRHPIITQPYLLSDTDVSSLASATSPLGYDVGVNTLDPVHGTKTAGGPSEYTNVFSPALVGVAGGSATGTVLAAAQIGGGQAVVSALNLGTNITGHNAATFAPADLYAAPAVDLKVLVNIITWSETHPSENKTSHGNASAAGLASFSPAWQYLPPPSNAPSNAPSGASVWGNFVFAVDATGVLRAFDAYPSENLTGNANAAGAETATSLYPATSYDEIWNVPSSGSSSVGTGASTPTVASFGGTNYVFVEKQDGTVVAFNAVTGTMAPFKLTAPASGGSFTGNAPAPTYYDGRLYAGQADGTLHVYDLNESTSAVVTLNPIPPATGGEPVTAAPSVGALADGDVNVLVAVVPTTLNVYTVLLGGRNEPLIPFNVNGALAGYSISRTPRYDLGNIFADVKYPSLLAYDYNGNVSATGPANTAPNPQDPLFAITNNAGYYTDWNMDFAGAAGSNLPPNPVNLNLVSADNLDELNPTPIPAMFLSAPAIDRHGDYYYTETLASSVSGGSVTNSYLVGVTNAPLYSRVYLKFRFRLPNTADATGTPAQGSMPALPAWDYSDADNVDYTKLKDYHFIGAPVVDDQDNVYVAATNGTEATVLCFRGNQPVSAVAPAGSTADLTLDTITQSDEGGGTGNTISRGPDTGTSTASLTYGQFIASPPVLNGGVVTAPSSIQFYNFGRQAPTLRQIAGNMTEPQSLVASPNDGVTTGTTTLKIQTNLAWFVTPFALSSTTSGGTKTVSQTVGLTQVGSSLLLTDGTALYRLSANPQVGANKVVSTPPAVTPLGVSAATGTATGVGAVASVPSVGGSVLVINGTNGIAARTRQVTVIADNNRILGVDGDGRAVWGVDATTRTDTTQALSVSTKVSFNHPTALSQFAVNDYLVADTGNNRCVRFDSAGNVQWELTRFQDLNGLLGAGQPLTLSQPASVTVRTVPDTATLGGTMTAANPGGSYVYYLVADSGNNRIVEVEDRVTASGSIFVDTNNNNAAINHVLSWVTHTGDRYGRSYRYGSAAYYANPATAANGSGISIAAAVTNTRLAPLAASGGLGAISGDAPGGSLVVFNYPATVEPFSFTPTPANDLVYTTAGFYAASGTGTGTTYTPYTIRNPRFLQLYTPTAGTTAASASSSVAPFDFLYADDNGVFDLSYDATKKAFIAGADRLQFKTSDYQMMATPVDASTTSGSPSTTYTRTGFPFIPTSVQALATDSQIISGTRGGANGYAATLTRRYLITQNYSQGELGNTTVTGKLGGEVFEVDVSAPTQTTAAGVTSVTGTSVVTAPGGFGGNSTLSHPALTGPLTQPTYAVRLP